MERAGNLCRRHRTANLKGGIERLLPFSLERSTSTPIRDTGEALFPDDHRPFSLRSDKAHLSAARIPAREARAAGGAADGRSPSEAALANSSVRAVSARRGISLERNPLDRKHTRVGIHAERPAWDQERRYRRWHANRSSLGPRSRRIRSSRLP